MARIDIIDTSALAYKTIWNERTYLVRLALIPILIKLACYIFALSAGFEDNILRLSLCLTPGYFAEGWMLSHLVRLIVLNQRWPFRPSGETAQDIACLKDRASGITAGTLSYVLINLFIAGFMSGLMSFGPHETDPAQVSPVALLIALTGFVLSIWGFKYIWLFIPMAVRASPFDYLTAVRGSMASFPLIGVWIMCFMPPVAAMLLFSGLVAMPFTHEGEIPQLVYFLTIIVRVIFDTVKAIVCTTGLTLAIHALFNPDTRRQDEDFDW